MENTDTVVSVPLLPLVRAQNRGCDRVRAENFCSSLERSTDVSRDHISLMREIEPAPVLVQITAVFFGRGFWTRNRGQSEPLGSNKRATEYIPCQCDILGDEPIGLIQKVGQ